MDMRHVLLAAAVGFGANAAHADGWNLTLQDFDHVLVDINGVRTDFGPATLGGSFAGVDLNHDGTIDLNEVSFVTFDGVTYTNSPSVQMIYAFSYGPAGLTISADYDHDWLRVQPGWANYDLSSPARNEQYLQTAASEVLVAPSSVVPEPASALLLAAGLGMLALVALRGRAPRVLSP